MRDEWASAHHNRNNDMMTMTMHRRHASRVGHAGSLRSSQGLTSRSQNESGLDRSATLNLAARAMKLKMGTKGLEGRLGLARQREVSERRQVGDAEGVINRTSGAEKPWWKDVTMEEGV